jgi:hypothetical protein
VRGRWLSAAPSAIFLALALLATAPVAAADDMDDVLGGFEDDEGFDEELDLDRDEPIVDERWWDITGSVSLGSSVAYLDHQSTIGTNYQGLTRLRTRLNLQLDLDLPYDWNLRMAGFVFYDFAYLIEGRSRFTNDVLDTHEWDRDFQEAYLQGSLLDRLDVKIGRQIVNWGRSDNIRVLDRLNPIDFTEPGLVDIEDLRRPVAMARLDYHLTPNWTITGIAIPEIRFNKDAAYGSEFYPAAFPPPHEAYPSDYNGNTEWAAAISGIFRGWDISFHFADIYEDLARLELVPITPVTPFGVQLHHSRLKMVGAGGNYTFGSWLFKGEAAWFDGIQFFVGDEKSRLDSMMGIEYYGFTDATVAFEFAHRHIFDFEEGLRAFPDFAKEDSFEYSFRYTAEWMHARLQTTFIALVFGEYAQDGSLIRLQGDYTIRDGLVATMGIVLYQDGNGKRLPFNQWNRNDRLFFELKYSF